MANDDTTADDSPYAGFQLNPFVQTTGTAFATRSDLATGMDNGQGAYGRPTVRGSGPAVALPPDVAAQMGIQPRQPIEVRVGNRTVRATYEDKMPHSTRIENGAGLDMNPDTLSALGLDEDYKGPVAFRPVKDDAPTPAPAAAIRRLSTSQRHRPGHQRRRGGYHGSSRLLDARSRGGVARQARRR